MSRLQRDIKTFLEDKKARSAQARQIAALQIACHLDLSEVLTATAADRTGFVLRLQRMIERERLRGARKHWSYDLNRHIALKQALDRVQAGTGSRNCALPQQRS